jgi:hypothetical protein
MPSVNRILLLLSNSSVAAADEDVIASTNIHGVHAFKIAACGWRIGNCSA